MLWRFALRSKEVAWASKRPEQPREPFIQNNVAQALALVVAGNCFVQGGDIGDFWPDAPVFQFTKRCQFISPSQTRPPTLSADVVAQTPPDWFLKEKAGCLGFRLRHLVRLNPTGITELDSNRVSVGLVGGGPRWLIEAVHEDRSEFWEGRGELLDANAPDKKIWANTYLRMATSQSAHELSARSPAQISAELAIVLPQIRQLALEIQMDFFATSFAAAEAALTADAPMGTGYYASLTSLRRFDLMHRQLLAAEEQAWVFGAMGSWNDVGPMSGSEKVRYDTLSDKLFGLLCEAIISVANSTYLANPPA